MNDRTLLELAARAAGYKLSWSYDNHCCWINEMRHDFDVTWNPRDDDGDALRLAVRLNLDIRYESYDAGVAVIVGGAWDDAPEAVHEISNVTARVQLGEPSSAPPPRLASLWEVGSDERQRWTSVSLGIDVHVRSGNDPARLLRGQGDAGLASSDVHRVKRKQAP
ncbi:hypothetical protein [Pseudomonas aeruginosa]|uniref:hypothetical protein n=1 Tax=Pseudomonas aeruginosa TaxID=287 RepID=UPI0029BFE66D|nr:hypothetical protein [Pseudomonas aeruginosa]